MPRQVNYRPHSSSQLVGWDFTHARIVQKAPYRGRFNKVLNLANLVTAKEYEARLKQAAHDAVYAACGSRKDSQRWASAKPLLSRLFADTSQPINEETVSAITSNADEAGASPVSLSSSYFQPKTSGQQKITSKMTKLEEKLTKLNVKAALKSPAKQAEIAEKIQKTSKQLDLLYLQKADLASHLLTPKPS